MNASRADAKKDQYVGGAKEAVGDTLGNESMQAKVKTQETQGHGQETAANAQSYVRGAINSVAGATKGAINSLTGNTFGEATNKVQKEKGDAQKSWSA